MSILKKFALVFQYGDELEAILVEQRKAEKARQFEAKRHHLKLCLKHQQESNHSHYSETNCDHCCILAQLKGNSNAN